MPPPPPPAVLLFVCRVNVRPSAPWPSPSEIPEGLLILKLKAVLNETSDASEIELVEKALALCPVVLVRRRLLSAFGVSAAAEPFNVRPLTSEKSLYKIVVALAADAQVASAQPKTIFESPFFFIVTSVLCYLLICFCYICDLLKGKKCAICVFD